MPRQLHINCTKTFNEIQSHIVMHNVLKGKNNVQILLSTKANATQNASPSNNSLKL